MRPTSVLIALLAGFLAIHTQTCFAYNILGVFPTVSKSHYIAGGALMRSLAADGHNVSVISPFPNAIPLPNFRDIPVHGLEKVVKEGIIQNSMYYQTASPLQTLATMYKLSLCITNYTLTHPVMTEFLSNQDEHFDVIIIETTIMDALYGLGPHFKAPIVGFSPLGASNSVAALVGTPVPMSYIPHFFLSFTDRMSFLQRLVNGIVNFIERTAAWVHLTYQEQIFNEVFKNQASIDEARKSIAFVLLNQHFSTSIPRPYVPNMVEVGGIHINRDDPKQLPDDIRQFVEGAEHGVIYFSFGTNILSSELPTEIRDGIMQALGKLKQRVLWKWEVTDLPGKPDNVMIKKWFPQDDVLAHPNIRLFITHGGLLGVSEAVYHGLPIVGVLFFADQSLNMARVAAQGCGLTIEYNNLTEASLTWALDEILTNPVYSEKAKEISVRYRDQPMRPMELAKYWVEYVARHKGAPHMQSAGLELSTFSYYSLDVYAVFIGVTTIWMFLVWRVFVALCWRRKTKEISKAMKRKVK